MRIEEYLDSIVNKYKGSIDKHSEIFRTETFSMNNISDLTKADRKRFEDNYAMQQMVYIPIMNRGQKTHDQGTLKMKYLQMENGLYISQALFKCMNLYEAKGRRDIFQVVL